MKIASKAGNFLTVDLGLDPTLKPAAASLYAEKHEALPATGLASTLVRGNTHAIGSASVEDKILYPHGDLGLFGCIFEAWRNHWVLRTGPEDWWFPVACCIAKRIDKVAKPSHWNSDKVRELFVSHQGKENIAIEVPVHTIYEVDYEYLFTAFSGELKNRIKVPDYAEAMQSDFSTSGSVDTICSQINLMASMQEFFSYEMRCCGCGLRGLEMKGTPEDWEKLSAKLKTVREILKPIEDVLWLNNYLDQVEEVYQKLAMTRKTPDDPEVAKFWINILMDTTGQKWVGGGGSFPGKPVDVKAYNGWLVPFLANREKILAEDLTGRDKDGVRKELSGWNQVPMKISLTYVSPPVTDMSILVAGIIGFKLHDGEDNRETDEDHESVPSVEPHHMWSMLLKPGSPVRGTQPARNSTE